MKLARKVWIEQAIEEFKSSKEYKQRKESRLTLSDDFIRDRVTKNLPFELKIKEGTIDDLDWEDMPEAGDSCSHYITTRLSAIFLSFFPGYAGKQFRQEQVAFSVLKN